MEMRTKRRIAMILASVLCVTCVGGCGTKEGGRSNSATEIEIAYWNSGLGSKWLDNMIEAFETKYPEYHVTYTASASDSGVLASFRNEETDTVDLYMVNKQYDTKYLEPIDDVLDGKAEGESKTIREKIDASYLAMENAADGKVYQLTYGGGVNGFVYNKKLFKEAGIDIVPRTTNELASVCNILQSKNITPLCHFKNGGYWELMNEAWFVQYDGMDYYLNTFYACRDENGNSPSKSVFTKKDGRYEVMKACEKILTPNYVLQGSNTSDHVTIQTEFLNGRAAMMINGSWLANEMASLKSVEDFGVMNTPVLSSITDKLTSVKKDSELREVISAIDSVVSGEKKEEEYQDNDNYKVGNLQVTKADWEYVRRARYTVPSNLAGETMFIPSYSNAKEGAKKFMEYMYSDEGYKVYTDSLHVTLPITLDKGTLDISSWSDFEKEMYQLTATAEQTATSYIMSKHPIFYEGGASSFARLSFVSRFCSNNSADRLSASEAWDEMLKIIDNDYDNNWMANISK